MLQVLGTIFFLEVCQRHAVSKVADFFVSETLEARHVVNKVLLISVLQKRNGVNKMVFLFLEACHVVNKVWLIFLSQKRKGVNKMFFFAGGTPCCQQSVADFFISETQWC